MLSESRETPNHIRMPVLMDDTRIDAAPTPALECASHILGVIKGFAKNNMVYRALRKFFDGGHAPLRVVVRYLLRKSNHRARNIDSDVMTAPSASAKREQKIARAATKVEQAFVLSNMSKKQRHQIARGAVGIGSKVAMLEIPNQTLNEKRRNGAGRHESSKGGGQSILLQKAGLARVLFACLFLAESLVIAQGTPPSGANYFNTYVQPNSFAATLSGMGLTQAYFVANSGSDTNTGADETHPFAHAPGMPGCANNCSTASTSAGTAFIFRGGDTWTFTTSVWNWSHSGTSSHPIYIGIDQSWFSGSSFARPIFTGGNATPTFGGSGTTAGSFVSSCPTNDNSTLSGIIELSGSANYVIIDGIEFTGICWIGSSVSPHIIFLSSSASTNNQISRNYFHGWSTNGTHDDLYAFYQANGADNVFAMNVVDGSDSSYGASTNTTNCLFSGYSGNTPCYTGGGEYFAMYDTHWNVFRHLSDNGVSTNTRYYYGNYVTDTNITSQAGGQHQNCNNMVGNGSGGDVFVFNNLFTEYTASECLYNAPPAGFHVYFFNNTAWGMMNVPGVGTFANNCFFLNVSQSAGSATALIYNNTISQLGGSPTAGAGCKFQLAPSNSPLNPWDGPVTFANNHLVGTTSLSGVYNVNGGASCNAATCPISDSGGEVYQTESSANGQGYTYSNNYAPTSGSGNSVGAGVNFTSSCPTFSPNSELCFSAVYATEQSGWGGQIVVLNTTAPAARPATGPWDAGAYEFRLVGASAAPIFAEDFGYLPDFLRGDIP